ncbi:B12-binding domain-containing radical SAM protein [Sporosarcina highlanderae]|uniref:B12-binding domain-containing radical SAM protein n=1 Tax=Sporosarcina highlanderae TaxID=3035916 RepID=A0ABT8JST5_9BACL|nr:B12-binding domain-containing radical SAM protein [Sporosarcina highlanderae]MDN4607972.1 B12-binding domain-containing radical SAM protein [Sporosarcina highlanderae]
MSIVLTTLNAKYIHTNLAIRYLKSYVMPEYEPILSEYTIKDPILNIVSDIHQKKPNIVGFSLYIWNIEESIKVIRILKKTNPGLVIVAGGPEVTYDYDKWLEKVPEIDFIVIGEGERTFKQLLDYHAGKIELSEVQGIAYKAEEKLKITAPGPKLDLRELPSPFRFPEDIPHLSNRVTYIETSRGCPFSCQFCLSSIEVGVRYFNREAIKDDIRYLMKNGSKTIKFVDRTFNISRSYAMEMFQFLIDEHLPGTVFQFEITGDIMRPEVIDFLNENAPKGLFRFEIGVQSTNDLTNELVKRRQNFEKLSRTVTMVKEGGKIAQHLDLIAGLPEEDYDSFRKTFNDVFAMRPEELQLGFLKLLRGTGLRIQAEQFGYTYIDEAPYEILSNNVLTFDEILRIKQTEDVLEKYWNDNRMPRTIEYLVSEVFETPFDFFQEFGTFWEMSGWSRIGHQLQDLYTRLEAFLVEYGKADMGIVRSLMKIDYLAHHSFQPRHIWWKDDLDAETLSGLERLILSDTELLSRTVTPTQLTERNIRKHTFITPVAVKPKEANEFIREEGFLVTFFCRGQEPQFHFLQAKHSIT